MEEVASRAGVGKATVYRRWPSRGALALDAFMAEFRSQLTPPDTGTLRGDLVAAFRAWSRAVTKTRAGRMLAGLIAETRARSSAGGGLARARVRASAPPAQSAGGPRSPARRDPGRHGR